MAEVPYPQRTYTESYVLSWKDRSDVILSPLLDELIHPLEVQTVVDLCCGQGIWTAMSLAQFPHAIVHSVDFHDVLVQALRTNDRVTFNQELIAEFLASRTLEHADIVILSETSSRHGLTDETIKYLAELTDIVITNGDTDNLLYMKSFHDNFALLKGNPLTGDSCVWGKKS